MTSNFCIFRLEPEILTICYIPRQGLPFLGTTSQDESRDHTCMGMTESQRLVPLGTMRSIGLSMDNSKEIDVIPSDPLVSTDVEKTNHLLFQPFYYIFSLKCKKQTKRNWKKFCA